MSSSEQLIAVQRGIKRLQLSRTGVGRHVPPQNALESHKPRWDEIAFFQH